MGLRSSNMQMLLPLGQKPIFTLDYDLREQRVFWACLQEESIKYAVHGEKGIIKTLVKGLISDAKKLTFKDGILCTNGELYNTALSINIYGNKMPSVNFLKFNIKL